MVTPLYSAPNAAKHDRAKDLSQANLENLLGDRDNHRDTDTQFTSHLEYAQALLHTGAFQNLKRDPGQTAHWL